MQIQPITEEAYNTAMLTLLAGRQELLYYRQRVVELQNIEKQYNDLKITSENRIQGLLDKISELVKPDEESDE